MQKQLLHEKHLLGERIASDIESYERVIDLLWNDAAAKYHAACAEAGPKDLSGDRGDVGETITDGGETINAAWAAVDQFHSALHAQDVCRAEELLWSMAEHHHLCRRHKYRSSFSDRVIELVAAHLRSGGEQKQQTARAVVAHAACLSPPLDPFVHVSLEAYCANDPWLYVYAAMAYQQNAHHHYTLKIDVNYSESTKRIGVFVPRGTTHVWQLVDRCNLTLFI